MNWGLIEQWYFTLKALQCLPTWRPIVVVVVVVFSAYFHIHK